MSSFVGRLGTACYGAAGAIAGGLLSSAAFDWWLVAWFAIPGTVLVIIGSLISYQDGDPHR